MSFAARAMGAPPGGNKIGAPVLLGSNAFTGIAVSVTSAAACPAGSFIGVFGNIAFTFPSSGALTDDVGNTYNMSAGAFCPNNVGNGLGFTANAIALPSGDKITASVGGTTNTLIDMICANIAGINATTPIDNISAEVTGTSTTPSGAEGTVVNANRIVFGLLIAPNAHLPASEPSGWTFFASRLMGDGSGNALHIAYKNVSGDVTPQTYAPIPTASVAWKINTIALQSA